jgi:hypothetical protein
MLLPERVARISTCDTEVDAVAADIMNRTAVSGKRIVFPVPKHYTKKVEVMWRLSFIRSASLSLVQP